MRVERAASSPGRIARLAVLVDAADPAWCVRLARMCEVARIDTLWLRPGDGDEMLATLGEVAAATSTLAVGVSPVDADLAGTVTASAGGRRLRDRLHLCVREPAAVPGLAPTTDTAGRLSTYVADRAQATQAVARGAVPVVRTTSSRATLAAALHDMRETLPAAELPVSIGRTVAEALARGGDGPVREVGLFGTLEQCQAQAQQLVHAGAAELRCVLPTTPDVDDVIAQLTAVAVGDRDRLQPDGPRSPDPPPPAGWGGPSSTTRSERDAAPSATADARRR